MTTLDGVKYGAPGWSLGLPKLLGSILIVRDGTHYPARRTAVNRYGQQDVDVSYIDTVIVLPRTRTVMGVGAERYD